MALFPKKFSALDTSSYPLDETFYMHVFKTNTTNEKIPTTFLGGYNKTVDLSDDYIITEQAMNLLLLMTRQASNKTITLPDAVTNKGQVITIVVKGASAGNVLLAGEVGQTINGVLIGSWLWYGTGVMTIVSDGNNYVTLGDCLFDIGSNSNGSFFRYSTGNMDCLLYQTTPSAITGANGALYQTAFSWTFPLPFKAATKPLVFSSVERISGSDVVFGSGVFALTNTSAALWLLSSTASCTGVLHMLAKGVWV